LTQIDFYVKDLSTPASLRSDKGWPISIGTSGRFGAELLAEFSGIGTIKASDVHAAFMAALSAPYAKVISTKEIIENRA
jgi:hypothetical protein